MAGASHRYARVPEERHKVGEHDGVHGRDLHGRADEQTQHRGDEKHAGAFRTCASPGAKQKARARVTAKADTSTTAPPSHGRADTSQCLPRTTAPTPASASLARPWHL